MPKIYQKGNRSFCLVSEAKQKKCYTGELADSQNSGLPFTSECPQDQGRVCSTHLFNLCFLENLFYFYVYSFFILSFSLGCYMYAHMNKRYIKSFWRNTEKNLKILIRDCCTFGNLGRFNTAFSNVYQTLINFYLRKIFCYI